MTIDTSLIAFETKEKFTGPSGLNNANEVNSPDANGYVGNIPFTSIVFILDSEEIWTHGKYFCNPFRKDLQYNVTNAINLNPSSWTKLENFTGWNDLTTGSYLLQAFYGNSMYTGYMTYNKENKTGDDEIVLHQAGTPNSVGGVQRGRLYAKLKNGYLYVSSSVQEDNASLNIILKKLL